MEDVFEEWNAYALKKELKQRNISLGQIEANSKLKIIAITGIRRCGKSSVLMLLHKKLSTEGKKTAFLNLEDNRIKNDKNALDSILKWFGDSGFLLLDEITNANDWSAWLARNHELLKGKLHFIVSSSRKSLIAPNKPLRGRILPNELYPLSFKEFLEFKGIKAEKTTAGIGKIEKALDEYLQYGGFPEVVLTENKTDKVEILNSYFKDIIGLDVAEISKEQIPTVELFGKYVIEATLFSASKCLNFFKSQGFKIGKQSLLNLEKYSQEGYLFFFIPVHSRSIKDRLQYSRKAFCGDTGFMYAISGRTDKGKLFENAVFLELKRKNPQNANINYWKNQDGLEVDFAVCEGLKSKQIIQVVYEMKDKKTKERETKALVACAKETRLKEGMIITKEFEGSETINGIRITYIPLWKWLLQ